ncbi:MAG: hypothetical protein CMH83_13010 [Nocardioides sp.]|nr:hypothetical protein [Nocardioides sp.]
MRCVAPPRTQGGEPVHHDGVHVVTEEVTPMLSSILRHVTGSATSGRRTTGGPATGGATTGSRQSQDAAIGRGVRTVLTRLTRR